MPVPFRLTQRDDSPCWCTDGQIGDKRWRWTTSFPNRPEYEREALREATAAYLEECAKRGAPADPVAAQELETLSAVTRFVDGQLKSLARKRHDKYADGIETDLLTYLVARFPLLSQLTGHAWGEWMASCHDRAIKPIKYRSVQRITSSVNVFLDWCLAVQILTSKIDLPYPSRADTATEEAERRAFTAGERDALLAAMKPMDRGAWRIYTTLLYSGLRKSGLERLQARWIDWDTGYVTYPASALKDKRSRRFYLRPNVLEVIREQMDSEPKDVKPICVFGVFDFDGHRRNADGSKRGLFWRALRAAGIDPHGVTAHHTTRHTACTIAGLRGASAAELMDLGGWRTLAMVQRYLHLDGQAAKRAAELL